MQLSNVAQVYSKLFAEYPLNRAMNSTANTLRVSDSIIATLAEEV